METGAISTSTSSYVGVLMLLVLNSFGLPIPEEIILVLAGAAVLQGSMDLAVLMALAAVAIALADFAVYLLGRRWGGPVLRLRFFRWILHPDKIESFSRRYEDHLLRGIFTVRFISGLRGPAYFAAGTLGVPAHKFVLTDCAAILVHVPIFTLIGYFFGAEVDRIVAYLENAERWVAVGLIALTLLAAAFIGYRLGLRKKKKDGGD